MRFFISIFLIASVFSNETFAYENKKNSSISPLAKSYIVSPKNGDTVSQTFTVVFGLKGMGVSPAGIDKANTGHHHLMVDSAKLPNLKVPLGKEVKHFGGGQTETVVTLTPGVHTLQLILADYQHLPHNPAVISEKITITVK